MDAEQLSLGITKRMKAENLEMQRRNEALELENQNLKRQIVDVSDLSAKMQRIAEENIEATRSIKSLETENKELKEKLEIMVQKSSATNEQLEKAKREAEQAQLITHNNLQTQLNELKLENQKLSSQKAKSENELNTKVEQQEELIQKLKNELTSLFAAASLKYNTDIHDFDSMMRFLSIPQPATPDESRVLESPESIEMKDTIRELKKANRKLKAHIQESETQTQRQILALKKAHAKEQEDLKEKLALAQENGEMQAQKITELLQEKGDMNVANSKLSAQIEVLKSRTEPKPVVSPPRDSQFEQLAEKYETLKSSSRVLKQQMAASISRTTQLEEAKIALKTKLKSCDVELNEAKTEIAFLHQEKIDADAENTQLSEEIESLKQKIESQTREAKQMTSLINQYKREIEQRKISFEQCERVIAQQTNEIRSLQGDRNHVASLLQNCLQLQASMEREIVELRQAEQKAKEEKSQKKEEPTIPVRDFCCEILPEEISGRIRDIATNQTLKARGRVKQAITMIYQYFIERIQDLTDEIKEVRFAYKQKLSDFNRFFESLRAALPGYEITTTGGEFTISTYVKQLRAENQNLAKNVAEKDRDLSVILSTLDVDNAEEAVRAVEAWKLALGTMKKKVQTGRRHIKDVQRQCRFGIVKMKQRICEVEEDLHAKQSEISQKELENEELKARLAAAVKAAQDAATERERKECEARIEEMREKTNEQIKAEIEKRQIAENKCKDRKRQLNKIRQKYAEAVSQNQQRMLEIRELKVQKEVLVKSNKEKLQSQQDAMFERYEGTVQALKAKNSQFKASMDDLNETVSKLEMTKNSLETQNRDLSHQLRRCQLQSEAQRVEMEREREIVLSRAKAEGLNREVDMQEKIQKLQYEAEAAKKDTMTLVGRQFCSLFDVTEQFTEESFGVFVRKIRSEFERMTRLERNVRHLLGLGPNQSIEDALSCVLLKK